MIEQPVFEIYRDFLAQKSGLVVTPDKAYLLESRLTPIVRKHELDGLKGLSEKISGFSPDRAIAKEVIEAMTTNETSFFRDQRPFDRLKDIVLPKMIETKAATRKIRIWCAAASSGQEPYSIAIMLKEQQALLNGWNVEIIATDIDDQILSQAQNAVYSQFEVQRGMPITLLVKYFTQEGDKWHLKDEIKNMVTFKNFNLLDQFMSLNGPFDIIFCRNVLIYFNEETKRQIFDKMHSVFNKDGYLFLGGAETIMGITDKFVTMPEQRGIFISKEASETSSAA